MATDINVNEDRPGAERTRSNVCFRPNVDIIETKDDLQLVADMPGVKSDSIDIRFEDGLLTVHGTVEPRWDEQSAMLLNEYGLGDFRREFRVSEQVDAGRISAAYADGVLRVTLPKAEAAKPRKIEVKAAG
jgi:HSP20 family protein